MTNMTRKTLILAAAMALAACDSEPTADAVSVAPDGTVTNLAPAHRSTADLAVEALANHLDIPVTEIVVDSVRPVDWPDSSIGCPQPDQAYLQVITPGHKIGLRANDRSYTVHEANGNAFVCVTQKAVPSSEVPQPLNIAWAKQAAQARTDLAKALHVEEQHIIIVGADLTTWSDAGMECGEATAGSGPIEGYVIRLRHGTRDYTFHTDMQRVIACPAITVD